MVYIRRIAAFTLCVCVGVLIAGCSSKPWMMEESTLTEKPIALTESRYIEKKPLAAFSEADAIKAASTYNRMGAGPLYVVVAHGENTTKGAPATRTKDIVSALLAQGIADNDIIASTVPLTTDTAVALIAFDTLEAQAPQGCTEQMPGIKSIPGKESDFDYKLGCTVKGYMAKQILYPKDLMGVEGTSGMEDGERAANIVNKTLKGGEPRDFLPSYVISTLAGSGG